MLYFFLHLPFQAVMAITQPRKQSTSKEQRPWNKRPRGNFALQNNQRLKLRKLRHIFEINHSCDLRKAAFPIARYLPTKPKQLNALSHLYTFPALNSAMFTNQINRCITNACKCLKRCCSKHICVILSVSVKRRYYC